MLARASARLEKSRKRAGGRAIDIGLRWASAAARLHPQSDPSRHGVTVERDVIYRKISGATLALDVYSPRRPSRFGEPAPVVLYVHGGAFQILSKDSHWLMGLSFARRGYVVFNIDYRLAPGHPYPAALEDVCAALVWVHENAGRFGGDPSRIIAAGESAGANLVAALAVAAAYDRPEPFAQSLVASGARLSGVVPICGVFQVSDSERFARRKKLPAFVADRMVEMERAYLGRADRSAPGGLALADPLVVLERGELPARPLPPFYLPVGTRDPLLDDTRRLNAALCALGVRCKATYFPGELHAFHAFLWRAQAVACWRETFAFVESCIVRGTASALSV